MDARIVRLAVLNLVAPVLAVCVMNCSSSAPVKESNEPVTPTEEVPQVVNQVKSKPAVISWQEKMQALSKALSRLLPVVSSRAKFNDPSNASLIDEETHRLRSLAHSLTTGEKPNNDPSLQMTSTLLGEDLDRASDGLKQGNRDYARQILKDTTAYCIQCHTQTNNGPDFPRLNLNIDMNQLTSLEQAEFLAATRQFDAALEAYTKVLNDKSLANTDPFAWEQAARSALAIVVRVKNDAKETARLISQIETNPTLPVSTKKSLQSWKKSVRDWSKEPRSKPGEFNQPDQVLAKAEQLITSAQKRQEFPLDHSQDILYFRAAGLLHRLLSTAEYSRETSARILYLAGQCSEATRDMNFWTLHETYYEQCIRTLPHSKQALLCYKRLEDSVVLGYSGSSGTKIPTEIQRRLDTFAKLASSEVAPEPPRSATPPPPLPSPSPTP